MRDLDLDVRVVACPIVREADGLAMSSRNVYLDADARAQATALNRALDAADAAHRSGERDGDSILSSAHAVLSAAGIDAEYLELRDAETLRPVAVVDRDALLLVAARVGAARLIDNHLLTLTSTSSTTSTASTTETSTTTDGKGDA